MSDSKPDFFSRIYIPYYQALFVASFLILVMLSLKLLNLMSFADIPASVYWATCGAGLLFFAIFNSVISLQEPKDMNAYWYKSFASYAILLVSSGLAAQLISGVSMDEAGTFKWIYFILTFAYLLFLSLMRFMRKIVDIAQKEDKNWQSRLKK